MLVTSKQPEALTAAEFASRVARKHGPRKNGEKKTKTKKEGEGVMKTAAVCLGGTGQMVDKGDPPKIHAQTHPHVQMPLPAQPGWVCIGIHVDKIMSAHLATNQRHTWTHQTRYCVCVVTAASVLTGWFPVSDPIMGKWLTLWMSRTSRKQQQTGRTPAGRQTAEHIKQTEARGALTVHTKHAEVRCHQQH